jgi:enolase-phosphatase E1
MIRAVLTDIEGTTSSLSFVKDVLFPHARKNIPEFIRKHFNDSEIQESLNQIRKESGEDPGMEQIIETLIRWIDQDKKITPLKALQGIIWKEGYEKKDFFGHIYPDAKINLEKWRKEGLKLYVYSSGSIFAQKLLFGHTEFGDLTGLFSGYFDTTTGQKKESASYKIIAEKTGIMPEEILFLSDTAEELDAAAGAKMKTCLLIRGSGENRSTHPHANNFNEINPADFA